MTRRLTSRLWRTKTKTKPTKHVAYQMFDILVYERNLKDFHNSLSFSQYWL